MQDNIQDTDILRLSDKRLCLCGCETVIDAVDSHGRQRYYVLGHNRRHHKTRDPLLREIKKIKSLDELHSIIQTQAVMVGQKDIMIEERDCKIEEQQTEIEQLKEELKNIRREIQH